MAKMEKEVADIRQRHGRAADAGYPNWGKDRAPPSPAIEVSWGRHRQRRQRVLVSDRLSGLLRDLMQSPATAEPRLPGRPILEAGTLACRRRKTGELAILLVSKRRSGKWGIPKGRVNGRLSFGEVAAKEAFEEAGIRGRLSPTSIAMFRMKKRTLDRQHIRVVEVWVYLMEVTERLGRWPEKGKREVRWVSCETAARHLRDPILAELCHRLGHG
jgi:8-oxo-dGTP pyrophosphatase MutT (NUDIX family)